MSVPTVRHYGFTKGRYAVMKLDHSSHRYKYYRVVDTMTDSFVSETFEAWCLACDECERLDRLNPLDPLPEVTADPIKPRTTDLPPIRVMGAEL